MELLCLVLFYLTIVWDILCARNGAMPLAFRENYYAPGAHTLMEENRECTLIRTKWRKHNDLIRHIALIYSLHRCGNDF